MAVSTKVKFIVISVIAVTIIATAGVFVWATTNSSSDTESSTGSTGKAADNKKVKNAVKDCKIGDENICKMMAAIGRHDSYIIHTKATMEGMESQTDFYIANPDLSRVVTTMAGTTMEMVMTADATYTKNGNGPWSKQSLSSEEIAKRKADRERQEIINSVNGTNADMSYESLGKNPCGAMTCFAYNLIDRTEPDMKTETLFDDKDYLPRQTTVTMDGTTTVMTYEYKKVTVNVPSV